MCGHTLSVGLAFAVSARGRLFQRDRVDLVFPLHQTVPVGHQWLPVLQCRGLWDTAGQVPVQVRQTTSRRIYKFLVRVRVYCKRFYFQGFQFAWFGDNTRVLIFVDAICLL
jgi:hypothetical protein